MAGALDIDSIIAKITSAKTKGIQSDDLLPDVGTMTKMCEQVAVLLLKEDSMLRVSAPIKVLADIHGQFPDLLRLFHAGGGPPSETSTPYLFLGDYVDRGPQSLEVLFTLIAFKLKYPTKIFLLRGNHEDARLTRIYGFWSECKRRYSTKLWKSCCQVFEALPVAALIDGKIFCCHGGIGPELKSIEMIDKIKRPLAVPTTGILADLLWADPNPTPGARGWQPSDRGISYMFGADELSKFLKYNNLELICRGHQVVEAGYEFFGERRLLTLFSAPNYCGEFDNAGAMLIVGEDLSCSVKVIKPIKP